MLKSHKVDRIEMPARGPTLREMSEAIRARKRARRKPSPILPMLRKITQGVVKASRSFEKSARSMPSDDQINKELWG